MELTPSFRLLLQHFRPVFTAPSFRLLSSLSAAGAVQPPPLYHRMSFHRRPSRHRPLVLLPSLLLALRLVPGRPVSDPGPTAHRTLRPGRTHPAGRRRHLVPQTRFGPVRCRHHHDPLFSSKMLKVFSWGHDWVVLALLVRLPRWRRPKCLPCPWFFASMSTIKDWPRAKGQASQEQTAGGGRQAAAARRRSGGQPPPTIHAAATALEMLQLLAGWFPQRQFVLLPTVLMGDRACCVTCRPTST